MQQAVVNGLHVCQKHATSCLTVNGLQLFDAEKKICLPFLFFTLEWNAIDIFTIKSRYHLI